MLTTAQAQAIKAVIQASPPDSEFRVAEYKRVA